MEYNGVPWLDFCKKNVNLFTWLIKKYQEFIQYKIL
jgi:hypothetical protein